MKAMKVIIIVLVLAILIAGAYVLYNKLAPMMGSNQLTIQPAATAPAAQEDGEAPAETTEPEKFLAPDVTVYDIDGNAHKLSDFRGKPVIMNFWATWCGFCKMEMPDFQAKFEEYGDQIHFLMVDMTDGVRETVEKASKFIEDEGFTFPVYYDTDLSVAQTYPVSGLPMTFFIDAEGNFIARGNGALNAEILQSGIDMLLEEQ